MSYTMFCRHCGAKIASDVTFCPQCGQQVSALQGNVETHTNSWYKSDSSQQKSFLSGLVLGFLGGRASRRRERVYYVPYAKPRSKWVALFLCLCFGYIGAHKFYEGKILLGILYACTFGLFCVGWVFDLFRLLFRPNPYFV